MGRHHDDPSFLKISTAAAAVEAALYGACAARLVLAMCTQYSSAGFSVCMYLLTLWFLVVRHQQKGGIRYSMVVVATLMFIVNTAVSPLHSMFFHRVC